MAKLTKLAATIDTVKYAFKGASGIYIGSTATETGITVIEGTDDEDLPEYPVKELLLKGILRRVNVVIRNSVDGKRRTLKLLVAKDKLATVLDALIDNTITTPSGKTSGPVVSVGFPRRVVSRG